MGANPATSSEIHKRKVEASAKEKSDFLGGSYNEAVDSLVR